MGLKKFKVFFIQKIINFIKKLINTLLNFLYFKQLYKNNKLYKIPLLIQFITKSIKIS